MRQRTRVALAVAALSGATIGLLLLSSPQAGSAPSDQLLPDLRVEQPFELYINQSKNATRLRTSNTVSNVGAGPLEIFPGDASDTCGSDGRLTHQRIFKDSADTGSPGYFRRSQDPDSETTPSGCSRYHPAHDHWHFDNFARYMLIRERNGDVVGRSRKVSFCVLDTGRPYPGLDGSPERAYYPQDPGSQFETCSSTSVDGLSIGWEDTYNAALPGQGIDITGLRGRRFCLILEADPPSFEHPAGSLLEENGHENDNVYVQRLRTRIYKSAVTPVAGQCQAPAMPRSVLSDAP